MSDEGGKETPAATAAEEREELIIRNRLGLHARAAAALVQLARSFSCDIQIEKGEKRVSGKSIMSVLQLAALQGDLIVVSATGPDSRRALDAIGRLVSERFGEPE